MPIEISVSETPSYAIAGIAAVFILTSVALERFLHFLGQWFERHESLSLAHALERAKEELMLLGFASILISVFSPQLASICVPPPYHSPLVLCPLEEPLQSDGPAPASTSPQEAGSATRCPEGKVQLMSQETLHQVHIFIFIYSITHTLVSILTLCLALWRLRMWRHWESMVREYGEKRGRCIVRDAFQGALDVHLKFTYRHLRPVHGLIRTPEEKARVSPEPGNEPGGPPLTRALAGCLWGRQRHPTRMTEGNQHAGKERSSVQDVSVSGAELAQGDKGASHQPDGTQEAGTPLRHPAPSAVLAEGGEGSLLSLKGGSGECGNGKGSGRSALSEEMELPGRFLLTIYCFFHHFTSPSRWDYFTLRASFISSHRFRRTYDFYAFLTRSLEQDFVEVVGTRWYHWIIACILLFINVKGVFTLVWVSLIPLLIALAIGTKLEYVMAQMALENYHHTRTSSSASFSVDTSVAGHQALEGEACSAARIRGDDTLFWLSRPELLLVLLHYVFFQTSYLVAVTVWVLVRTHRLDPCGGAADWSVITRLSIVLATTILCSFVTLPLYALVCHMGSHARLDAALDPEIVQKMRSWGRRHHKSKEEKAMDVMEETAGMLTSATSTSVRHLAQSGRTIVRVASKQARATLQQAGAGAGAGGSKAHGQGSDWGSSVDAIVEVEEEPRDNAQPTFWENRGT